MSFPKRHHYVPRFYLQRFTNERGKIWVYDKLKKTAFETAPENIASQTHFYRVDENAEGVGPSEMENQFAGVEAVMNNITNDWFGRISRADYVPIPQVNRDTVSLYIALQLLRTVEAREQLVQFNKLTGDASAPQLDARSMQINFLWNDELVKEMAEKIKSCIWIFGLNKSPVKFLSSDHPALIKNKENTHWI